MKEGKKEMKEGEGKERGKERGVRGREQGFLADILNRDQYSSNAHQINSLYNYTPLKLTEMVVAISLYGTGLALLLCYHFAISTAILQ